MEISTELGKARSTVHPALGDRLGSANDGHGKKMRLSSTPELPSPLSTARLRLANIDSQRPPVKSRQGVVQMRSCGHLQGLFLCCAHALIGHGIRMADGVG
jgi:hypothetical protein